MADLTTLEAIRRDLKSPQITLGTSDDDLLRRLIHEASAYIEQRTGRWFVALRAVQKYDALGDTIGLRHLDTPDLLEVVTLTNGDGIAYGPSDFVLEPYNRWPKTRIQLKLTASGFAYSDDPYGAIQVDGWWGFHSAYASAWIATLDTVQDNPLTAGATSITVADADGLDAHGDLRFPVLGYCKIENEVVQVTAANPSTNVLTVWRGVQGTTAVQHIKTTAISRYIPDADIERACLGLVNYLYRTKDIGVSERIQTLDGTVQTNTVPQYVLETIARHIPLGVG